MAGLRSPHVVPCIGGRGGSDVSYHLCPDSTTREFLSSTAPPRAMASPSISAPANTFTLAPAPPASQARTKKPSQLTGEIEMCSHEEDGDMNKDLSPVEVDHTFEFHLISAEMNFSLHAVVVFTIAPRTNDDDNEDEAEAEAEVEEEEEGLRYDDNMFHHFNKLELQGVIVELVASMIFRGTTNSSINHQAVVLLENIQLELNKRFRRVVVYVKPHLSSFSFVDGGQMIQQEVTEDGLECEQQAWLVQVEPDVDGETKVQHKMQSSERPSKIDEIKELSCTWACQSLKPLIFQVVYGNVDTTADQLKQHIKLLSSYSLKALWFAIPMFYASLSHHSSTSKGFSVGDALFLVAIITDAALILLLPTLGNALVCISWLLLELAACVLILSFNKHYAFAILATLLLVTVVALLQPKLQHAADRHVLPSFTQDMIGDDEESQHLGHLLELSQGIASFGGLFTAIAQRFMVGPVNMVGFISFCAIALGLYLSMVVTVGAVSHAHAKCLAILVMVLVVLTFIAACIPFVGHSGSKPQVAT